MKRKNLTLIKRLMDWSNLLLISKEYSTFPTIYVCESKHVTKQTTAIAVHSDRGG